MIVTLEKQSQIQTNHSFNKEFAKMYGIEEAIIIRHFQFWIKFNKNKNANNIDGKTWTYQSIEYITKNFPYLTYDRVRRAIESLVRQNVIIKGNYNKIDVDKTSWYSFFDEEKFISYFEEKEEFSPADGNSARWSGNSAKPVGNSAKPIPDTKPVAEENLPTYPTLPSNEGLNEGLVGSSSKENLAARQATESKVDAIPSNLLPLEPKPIPEPLAAKSKQDAHVAPIHAILESLAIPREEKLRIAKHLTDITLLQRVIDYLEIPEIKVKINSITGSIFHYYHHPEHMKKNIKKAAAKPSVSEGDNRAFLREISNLLVTEKIRQRQLSDNLEILDERGTIHKFYFRDGSFIEQLENFLRKIGHWHAQLISFFRRFREPIGLLQPKQSYG